jgi:hypothetical protein
MYYNLLKMHGQFIMSLRSKPPDSYDFVQLDSAPVVRGSAGQALPWSLSINPPACLTASPTCTASGSPQEQENLKGGNKGQAVWSGATEFNVFRPTAGRLLAPQSSHRAYE